VARRPPDKGRRTLKASGYSGTLKGAKLILPARGFRPASAGHCQPRAL